MSKQTKTVYVDVDNLAKLVAENEEIIGDSSWGVYVDIEGGLSIESNSQSYDDSVELLNMYMNLGDSDEDDSLKNHLPWLTNILRESVDAENGLADAESELNEFREDGEPVIDLCWG